MNTELLRKIAGALVEAGQVFPANGYESKLDAAARALVAALETRGLRIVGGGK